MLLFRSLRVFHTSYNWWPFTGVYEIASLRSPWLFWIILVDFNNALLSVVLILPLIFLSSNLCPKALGTVPCTPSISGITVTFMSLSFVNSLRRSNYLSAFLLSFIFPLWSNGTTKSTSGQVLLCLLINTKVWFSDQDARIHSCLKIPENFMRLIFRTDSDLCIYHLLVWPNLNLWRNSEWITFPSKSCLVCAHFRPIHNYFTLLRVFHTNVSWWFFPGSLSDRKSPRVFISLLSILVDLNNAAVSIFPLTFISSIFFQNCGDSSKCTD